MSSGMAERLATMTREEKIAELEKKRELLKQCNDNIERLKAALEVAKVQKAAQDQKDAIARAPYSNKGLLDDILIQIFREYIKQSSMGIRRLVRVCHGWRNLILQTGELWSNIRLEIPSKANEITPCVEFCKECIKRSGEAPLDVYVDYTTAGIPFERVLFEHLLEPLQKVNEDPEYRQMLDSWLWRRCRSQNAEFFTKYQEHFIKPLVELEGGNGAVMARWRSFELHGRQDGRGLFNLDLIGPILNYPAVNLQSLKIVNMGRYSTEWDGKNKEKMPFTQLPKLEHLSLTYCHIPLEILDVKPEQLKTVELSWYSTAASLAQIIRCRNAITLTVTVDHALEDEQLKEHISMNPGEHEFPVLQTMRIGGRMRPIFWTACSFPAMEDLTFVDGRGPPSLVGDDQFTFPNLHTITFLGPPVNKDELVSFTHVFKKIVLCCPALHTINALDKYSEQILKSFGDLKASGVTSGSLTSLVLKTKRTDGFPCRTIDLQPIIGRA